MSAAKSSTKRIAQASSICMVCSPTLRVRFSRSPRVRPNRSMVSSPSTALTFSIDTTLANLVPGAVRRMNASTSARPSVDVQGRSVKSKSRHAVPSWLNRRTTSRSAPSNSPCAVPGPVGSAARRPRIRPPQRIGAHPRMAGEHLGHDRADREVVGLRGQNLYVQRPKRL